MNIEIVRNAGQFAALRDEWNALVDRSRTGFVTLTWEWLFTWWEIFGEGRQLQILLAREGDRLVGIAPLHCQPVREFGLPIRRLQFLASGENEADEICSDYLDFIVEAGHEPEVIEAFAEFLKQDHATDWEELRLVAMRADSPTLPALERAMQDGRLRFAEQPRAQSVVVFLPDDWERLLMTLSKKMRFRVRRHRRLLGEKGPVRFWRVASAEELRDRFPQFIDLHQRWWTSRGKPGCFSSRKFTAFHQALSPRLLERNLLDLYFLSVADQIVAARYSFHYNGRVFDYQTGVDPEFDPRIGVGVECTGYCIEDAIRRGFKEYDFGEGLHPYKLRWTDQLRATVNVRIVRPGLKQRVRETLADAKEQLRAVRRKLRLTPSQPGDFEALNHQDTKITKQS